MKKIITGALIGVFALGLVGCSSKAENTISVITREDGSGTRGAFTEIVGLIEDDVDTTTLEAIVHDGTGKVMTAVAGNKNSVGYISLGSLNDTVKAVSIDGVEPTTANVASGEYKLARPFNIAYNDDLGEVEKDLINFIISANGAEIINSNGFISVEENADYASTLPSGSITIGGSTSVYPVMEILVEGYKELNPNAEITIEGIGSSAGMKGVTEGIFDIGMASRELKDSEKEVLSHRAIAVDGIALVVNNENELKNLTIDNVKGMYNGQITDFSELN